MIIYVSGGGGFGNPRERDLELIEQDLVDGEISGKFARKFYGFTTSKG